MTEKLAQGIEKAHIENPINSRQSQNFCTSEMVKAGGVDLAVGDRESSDFSSVPFGWASLGMIVIFHSRCRRDDTAGDFQGRYSCRLLDTGAGGQSGDCCAHMSGGTD